jgi:hypothetical protein
VTAKRPLPWAGARVTAWVMTVSATRISAPQPAAMPIKGWNRKQMAYKAASTADQTARSGQRRSKNFGSGPGRGLAAARRRDLAPPHSKSLPSQRLFVLLQVYDLVLPSQGVLVGLGLLVAGLIAQGDLGCHSWPRAPDWALQGWSCAAGLVLCIADPAVVGREREAGRERALGQATKLSPERHRASASRCTDDLFLPRW